MVSEAQAESEYIKKHSMLWEGGKRLLLVNGNCFASRELFIDWGTGTLPPAGPEANMSSMPEELHCQSQSRQATSP